MKHPLTYRRFDFKSDDMNAVQVLLVIRMLVILCYFLFYIGI